MEWRQKESSVEFDNLQTGDESFINSQSLNYNRERVVSRLSDDMTYFPRICHKGICEPRQLRLHGQRAPQQKIEAKESIARIAFPSVSVCMQMSRVSQQSCVCAHSRPGGPIGGKGLGVPSSRTTNFRYEPSKFSERNYSLQILNKVQILLNFCQSLFKISRADRQSTIAEMSSD